MYLPPQFRADDPALACAVMRAHPLATLVSVDAQGEPLLTHLPLHLQAEGAEAGQFTLLGHVARGNPHGALLRERPRVTVSFLGPHAYLSPQVYPDRQRVPTWNYLAVECVAETTVVDDPHAKDALLKQLIGDHEPPYAQQWRGLDSGYQDRMLAGITAFTLRVTRWACKLKLNQHRPESHAAMHARYAAGSAHERELAQWMERLGLAQGFGAQ